MSPSEPPADQWPAQPNRSPQHEAADDSYAAAEATWSEAFTAPYTAPMEPALSPYALTGGAPPPPPWPTTYPPTLPSRATAPRGMRKSAALAGLVALAAVALIVLSAGALGRLFTPTANTTLHTPPTPAPKVVVRTTVPTATPTVALTLNITCLETQHQDQATICVQTVAGALLTITTTDCDGRIDHNAPTTGQANGAGTYQASWQPRRPNGGCRTATVQVAARLHNQQLSRSGTLMLPNSGDNAYGVVATSLQPVGSPMRVTCFSAPTAKHFPHKGNLKMVCGKPRH